MVLPVPGGPQKISEPSEPAVEHARQRAVGPEQMILADHLGERLRAQLVGERPRRVVVQPRRREQAWACAAFGAGGHPPNTAEICWPPRWMVIRQTTRAGLGELFEVARLGDLLMLTASTMSPRWKPNCCASVPSAISTTTTPSVDESSRSSSASAGERLATLAPVNGERRLDHDLIARRLRRGFKRDRDLAFLAAANHAELDLAAERMSHEAVVERVRIVDRLVADRDDDVARLEAGTRRRARR